MKPMTSILLILGVWTFTIVALFGGFWLSAIKRRRNERRMALETARHIIESKGYENRHRFVDDDTIEYLYLVLGETSKGPDLVWAMVRVGRETTTVTIQHIDTKLLKQNSRQMVADAAKDLRWALTSLGYQAEIEAVASPPNRSMTGVSRFS
ncbi:MAG TPA: hypothetical protein VHE10_02505 [Candidatus Paceibacterota bacterium]|nr:hypothetical protein [Candidatus Paceibacterota bacterium]